MRGKHGISFPVSSPMCENWKRGGNETGNGLVETTISNGKSGNEVETGFRSLVETRGPKNSGSFPCGKLAAGRHGRLNGLADDQTRSGGNVGGRRGLL